MVRLFLVGEKLTMFPLVYTQDKATKKGPRLRFCCGSGMRESGNWGEGRTKGRLSARVREMQSHARQTRKKLWLNYVIIDMFGYFKEQNFSFSVPNPKTIRTRPTPLLTRSWRKDVWFFASFEAHKMAEIVRRRKKMTAMGLEQVQRFILAKSMFWG